MSFYKNLVKARKTERPFVIEIKIVFGKEEKSFTFLFVNKFEMIKAIWFYF